MALDGRIRTTPVRPAVYGGLLVAVIALAAWGVWLAGGEGDALKALVAVWLAALPVLGIGALAGWLVASAVPVFSQRPRPVAYTGLHEEVTTRQSGEAATGREEQDERAERA
jgi:hypothetical protein